MRDHPRLGIHVELQPFGREIGFRIDEPDMACGNHDAGQGMNRHVIGRETHGALIDYHRAIGFVGLLLLEIINAFGSDIERERTGGCRRRHGSSLVAHGMPDKREQQPHHQPAGQTPG